MWTKSQLKKGQFSWLRRASSREMFIKETSKISAMNQAFKRSFQSFQAFKLSGKLFFSHEGININGKMRKRERGVKDGRIPKVVEDGWDPKGSGGWVGYQGCGEQKGEIDAFPHKMLYFVNV